MGQVIEGGDCCECLEVLLLAGPRRGSGDMVTIQLEKVIAFVATVLIPSKKIRKGLRMKVLRALFTLKARKRAGSFGKNTKAVGPCVFSKRTFVGEGTLLGGIVVLGGGEVRIGNHVSTGPGLIIQTQNHEYEGDNLPYTNNCFVRKNVIIDDCVWIGMNVSILPGTHIGEGAIIQMGSVVHGNIPPCAIAGGNPAKVFAWRDKARYEKLKVEKKYTAFGY